MTELASPVAQYFPYTQVRPHQDEFTTTVFEAINSGRSALVEGSNGLGKTVSALVACLPKAVEQDLKILYVARTHRQHERVIEELRAISKKQPISGISIRGRHEMCLNDFVTGHAFDARAIMEACELLKSKGRCPYYRSIQEETDTYFHALQEIVSRPHKATEIQKLCQQKRLCPYELAKAALSEVNVVALSYLYVFDPAIRIAFLKSLDTPFGKTVLIVDEAHNLPETAAEIASASLSLFALKQAELEARKFDCKDIAAYSKVLREAIEESAAEIRKEALIAPEFLTDIVQRKARMDEPLPFYEHMQATGSMIRRTLLTEGKYPRSYVHGVAEFLLKWHETAEDSSYVNVISKYVSKGGARAAKLEIVALDPSRITEPVFSSVYSSIVMSGTLQPLDAYARITHLPEDTVKSVVPSPFPKEHILPLICEGVTTAKESRTPAMYRKIISRIKEVVQNTPANTGVFAASFEVLEALINEELGRALDRPLFHERRGMRSKENERMVAQFKANAKTGGAVLLGVQGGRSSEGVDFPGDQMNAVVIVGVPYAEPTPKVKAQIDYFEKCFPGYGREYGYVIPAMKKASQAAGRPIRTLEDRGAMIFLDQRFASAYCRSLLPVWIRDNLRVLQEEDGNLANELQRFFKTV